MKLQSHTWRKFGQNWISLTTNSMVSTVLGAEIWFFFFFFLTIFPALKSSKILRPTFDVMLKKGECYTVRSKSVFILSKSTAQCFFFLLCEGRGKFRIELRGHAHLFFCVYVFLMRVYIPSEFKQVFVLLGCKSQSLAEHNCIQHRS